MSWWPWELERRVDDIDTFTQFLAKRIRDLESKTIGADMSKLHDKLSEMATELDQSVDKVSDNTITPDEFADVIAEFQKALDKLKKLEGGGFTPSGN